MPCASFSTRAGIEVHQQAGMVAGQLDFGPPGSNLSDKSLRIRLLDVFGHGIAPPHLVAALAAHGLNVDFLVGVARDELEGNLEDVGVEGAGKALVARDHDEKHALFRPGQKQRAAQVAGLLVVEIDAARERLQDAGDHARVRPRRQRSLLRLPELGRRDHLHGLGDLPRVFHAADSAP